MTTIESAAVIQRIVEFAVTRAGAADALSGILQ